MIRKTRRYHDSFIFPSDVLWLLISMVGEGCANSETAAATQQGFGGSAGVFAEMCCYSGRGVRPGGDVPKGE